ncbi:armadillo-type protein [Mycena rosella]|uniref:Armadillo-type protein n=1 Tax=Mycena rosella TaxID=1033263 RepID=A0AAD7GX86_MYCRO|nr:armadillo-type protein [Mycena rosella]
MPPLTRQRTLDSVRSWWSDSNPTGPNINLHAATKPLMRRLYHRAALDFIKQNRASPLSSEDMEIYSSYLACKYVSSSTKTAILEELSIRVDSTEGASTVVESPVLYLIDELLDSPDAVVRGWTCWLLAELGRRKSSVIALLIVNPCFRLVFLLRDSHMEVAGGAVKALYRIAASLEGAQAAVDAGLLNFVDELLESQSTRVREWTCGILGHLMSQETTRRAVLSVKPCVRLVSHLRNNHLGVLQSAAEVFCIIAQWPEGAQAAMEANALDSIPQLLESPDVDIRVWTCKMVGLLARHLMSLLCEENLDVIAPMTRVLCWIGKLPAAAQAAVDADILTFVAGLLQSPTPEVREWTCELLGELARHESTEVAILSIDPCPRLVSLLRDENLEVVDAATYVLCRITQWPDGSQAAVEANLWDCVAELLESPASRVREWACKTIGHLARREPAVGAATMFKQLAPLLRDDNSDVIKNAAEALYWIATSPEGVQGAVGTQAVHCVAGLLHSTDADVQRWTCEILGHLASREFTAADVLKVNPCSQFVSHLSNPNLNLASAAGRALMRVAQSPDGAQAVLNANALDCLQHLLQSWSPELRQNACRIASGLAFQEITAAAILRSGLLCRGLVSLLCYGNPGVVESAADALRNIAESANSLLPDVDTEMLVNTFGAVDLDTQFNEPRRIRGGLLYSLGVKMSDYQIAPGLAILGGEIWNQLLSLLRHSNLISRAWAVFILATISQYPDGAQAIAATDILAYLPELMAGADCEVQFHTCLILRNLARYPPVALVSPPRLGVKVSPPRFGVLVVIERFTD